ncbi:class I SAM-dependent methyltransferase [Candidatus Thioglobus sp.]|nr:class I SAM-dependent methyltransferase [Candidatus Thioglobus sp.]
MKQYSAACDQNKDPILKVIKPLLLNAKSVLEVGSGTGQHCVYFAKELQHLTWQASDQAMYLPSVDAWIDDAHLANTPKALELNVDLNWPEQKYQAIYSANTVHIMSWEMVLNFFKGVEQTLEKEGVFILYGPFNYNGQYTSQSNADFDLWLKDNSPLSAIRDFERLDELAKLSNLILTDDIEMPANNRVLVWRKNS